MQEKHLQRPCNSTETNFNSSKLDIFLFIPITLWEPILTILIFWNLMLFLDI